MVRLISFFALLLLKLLISHLKILPAQKHKIWYKIKKSLFGFFVCLFSSPLLRKFSLSVATACQFNIVKTSYAHEKFPRLRHCLLLGKHLITGPEPILWCDLVARAGGQLRVSMAKGIPVLLVITGRGFWATRKNAVAITARASPLPMTAVPFLVEMLVLVPCQSMYNLGNKLSFTVGWTLRAGDVAASPLLAAV